MCSVYYLTSHFLVIADATLFNLSLLTSDVYAVLFAYFVTGAFVRLFCPHNSLFVHPKREPSSTALPPGELVVFRRLRLDPERACGLPPLTTCHTHGVEGR
jgi:hypothetical protein